VSTVKAEEKKLAKENQVMIFRKEALIPFVAGAAVGFAVWAGALSAQSPVVQTGMEQNIVADVNGVLITRQQLAEELIARKGKSQLHALVNRTMIEQACKAKGITVDDKEVQADLLAQMKAAGSVSIQDFEKGMLTPMKTTLFEYREDVIRPRLLLEKYAKAQLTVTDEDLKREFAACYGEKVDCRMIIFKDERLARKGFSEINNNRANFIRLANQQEGDLAAVGGKLKPFGRHTAEDVIEKRAFEMQVGEVSEAIQTSKGAWVLLLKEGVYPARTDVTFEQKREELLNSARERKGQAAMPEIISSLKREYAGKIKVYLGEGSNLTNILNQYQNLNPDKSK
jgi:parvulin-like peptidyl-prolyl isomerase